MNVLQLKKMIFGLWTVLSLSAFGAHYDAIVQKSPLGPKFTATLDTELEVSKWAITKPCYQQVLGGYYFQDYAAPEFTLAFRDLVYKPSPSSHVTLSFKRISKCDPTKQSWIEEWFSLQETETGYIIGGDLNFDLHLKEGLLPSTIGYLQSSGETVLIKIKGPLRLP